MLRKIFDQKKTPRGNVGSKVSSTNKFVTVLNNAKSLQACQSPNSRVNPNPYHENPFEGQFSNSVKCSGEKGEPTLSGAALSGCPDGGAAFPCLNSNNSTETYTKIKLGTAGDQTWYQFPDGRQMVEFADGRQEILGGLSTSQRKAAFALSENIAHLVRVHGVGRIGFLTLTFPDNCKDWREAQRRFNSLCSHYLRGRFGDWVVCVEPQKRGAIHYHLVVVVGEDIRSGIDFEALAKRDYRSASPYLRSIWRDLRKHLPKYGFGRSELLPVKSTGDGIARYVGKYLDKGCAYRGDAFKGARMVRYSQGWRAVSPRFSWTSDGARNWRKLVGDLVSLVGGDDLSALSNRFGKSWAWQALQLVKRDATLSAEEVLETLRRVKHMKDNGLI